MSAEPYTEKVVSPGMMIMGAERRRQITVEGWVPEHDADHGSGELSDAGAEYASAAASQIRGLCTPPECGPNFPFSSEWWKPTPTPLGNLRKAAGLLVAEMDRIYATMPFKAWMCCADELYAARDKEEMKAYWMEHNRGVLDPLEDSDIEEFHDMSLDVGDPEEKPELLGDVLRELTAPTYFGGRD